MAILKNEQVLHLPIRWQDLLKFAITDDSPYTAVVGNTRADAARILVAAKMTEDQVLTFIIPIDNTLPLSKLSYDIISQGDGAYRFFYFNILFYAAATTYQWQVKDATGKITQYGDIIYKSGFYYTPKVATVIAVEPTVTTNWANSWEIYDIANLKDLILSDQLDIHIHDDIFSGNYELCILEQISLKTDEVLCGICVSPDSLLKLYEMEFLLDAANSMNWQKKAVKAEIILKEAIKRHCEC